MNRHAIALGAGLLSLAALALPVITLAVTGSGNKVTQSRQVPAFSAVRNDGSLDVTVEVGPAASVAVTIDDNLQPEVETTVTGDTLVIRMRRGGVSYRGEGRVAITAPRLTGYAVHGSGDAVIQGNGSGAPADLTLSIDGSGDVRWTGEAARLTTRIDGSGDVALSGKAQALQVNVNGSGDVKAKDLVAGTAGVEVNGSGDVEATLAGGPLRVRVHGSGDVRWWGDASSVDAVAHGSGDIAHR
jgi:hypothetical protein